MPRKVVVHGLAVRVIRRIAAAHPRVVVRVVVRLVVRVVVVAVVVCKMGELVRVRRVGRVPVRAPKSGRGARR